MVTTDALQGAFKAIVDSLSTRVTFYSVWSSIKDEQSTTDFPACFWKGTDTEESLIDAGVLRPSFDIDCMFVEQTASDRSSESRDLAFHRMNTIARMVWARFVELYVTNSGTFQGVELDFDPEQLGTARFLRVFDSGTMQMTGVWLRVTIVSGAPTECQDIYFNAS